MNLSYEWASHRQGQKTRSRILKVLASSSGLPVEAIATSIGRSERQTRRQLQTLISERKIRKTQSKQYKLV